MTLSLGFVLPLDLGAEVGKIDRNEVPSIYLTHVTLSATEAAASLFGVADRTALARLQRAFLCATRNTIPNSHMI